MPRLPAAFAALEPYVDTWVLPDTSARAARRLASDQAALEAFYHAALAAAPAALAHLATRRLDELDPTEECLLKLMLALAEVGPAVEWYGQPGVIGGFPAARFPLVETLSDTAPQE